jgi:hypothetical protein
MNTCRNPSKTNALILFTINTYEKQGEGVTTKPAAPMIKFTGAE